MLLLNRTKNKAHYADLRPSKQASTLSQLEVFAILMMSTPSVNVALEIFQPMWHFSTCDTFFQGCRNFPIVAHFSRCTAFFQGAVFFQVRCTFPSLAHFLSVLHFSKCRAFFELWRMFQVRHFSKCATLFQVCGIFPSVAYFSKGGTLFQVRRISPCQVCTFSKYGAFSLWVAYFRLTLVSADKCLELRSLEILFFIGIIHDFLCSSNS